MQDSFNNWLEATLRQNHLSYSVTKEHTFEVAAPPTNFKYARSLKHLPADENTIVIWEDWWVFKKEIVKSRIQSKLGLLYKIPARVCEIERISKPEADTFLAENHLNGAAGGKIKYGLFLPEKYFRLLPFIPDKNKILLAVMVFSGSRKFTDNSRSFELIRFCVRCNYHVHGGFSKLFKKFIEEKQPDSVMTYVDLDWQTENPYEQIGFKTVGKLPPIYFVVDENGNRQKTTNIPVADGVNSGSIKMLWQS